MKFNAVPSSVIKRVVCLILVLRISTPTFVFADPTPQKDIQHAMIVLQRLSRTDKVILGGSDALFGMGALYAWWKAGNFTQKSIDQWNTAIVQLKYFPTYESSSEKSLITLAARTMRANAHEGDITFFTDAVGRNYFVPVENLGFSQLETISNISNEISRYTDHLTVARMEFVKEYMRENPGSNLGRLAQLSNKAFRSTLTTNEVTELDIIETNIERVISSMVKDSKNILGVQLKRAMTLDQFFQTNASVETTLKELIVSSVELGDELYTKLSLTKTAESPFVFFDDVNEIKNPELSTSLLNEHAGMYRSVSYTAGGIFLLLLGTTLFVAIHNDTVVDHRMSGKNINQYDPVEIRRRILQHPNELKSILDYAKLHNL